MIKQIYLALILMTMLINLRLSAQCPSGNNTFTGAADGNWSNDLNWSEGCKPPSPITGFISIEANCTLSGTEAYTFDAGSTFQIKSGVIFTNGSSGTWTMNGSSIGSGTYAGNLTIGGPVKPGCSTGTVTHGGQTYATKLMPDGKWWMAENLNVGTRIDGINNQANNGTIEKYCYNNEAANCAIYGGLYQWNEMMQYVTTQGTQGICPDGWHLPTDAEWSALLTALPAPDKGSRLAGDAALWTDGALDLSPHFGTSGFVALPAGGRFTAVPFSGQSISAYVRSSTESGSSNAWSRFINFNGTGVTRFGVPKSDGFSVRCVQD